MKNIVITIGREYGSGGKSIAKEVAQRLNIPFYDKEIIHKTYEKTGCNYSKLAEYDEKEKSSLMKTLNLFNINNTYDGYENITYQNLISNTIKELANTSCVILGRNANQILKDQDNVINIFIYSSNQDFKIKRKMILENLTYEEALYKMKKVDKQRKNYYESMNEDSHWGDKNSYDFLIDSSILGIDKTVELIINIYHMLNN